MTNSCQTPLALCFCLPISLDRGLADGRAGRRPKTLKIAADYAPTLAATTVSVAQLASNVKSTSCSEENTAKLRIKVNSTGAVKSTQGQRKPSLNDIVLWQQPRDPFGGPPQTKNQPVPYTDLRASTTTTTATPSSTIMITTAAAAAATTTTTN